jgi:hypothetical protein
MHISLLDSPPSASLPPSILATVAAMEGENLIVLSVEEKETTRGEEVEHQSSHGQVGRLEAVCWGGNGHEACCGWISHFQCFVKKTS